MRIHIKLSKNRQPVEFNYQSKIVGCIHKWLGKNDVHDDLSLYSFSWLKNGISKDGSLDFKQGSNFFISFHHVELLKKIISGIQAAPDACYGMIVNDIMIEQEPEFQRTQRFSAESPIFIKYRIGDKTNFFYYNDPKSNELLTNNVRNKLHKAGLSSDGFKILFDADYKNAYTKGITYRGIFSKGSICPVIVEGTPEQLKFVWNVGVGNNTGIGFGSLSKID